MSSHTEATTIKELKDALHALLQAIGEVRGAQSESLIRTHQKHNDRQLAAWADLHLYCADACTALAREKEGYHTERAEGPHRQPLPSTAHFPAIRDMRNTAMQKHKGS